MSDDDWLDVNVYGSVYEYRMNSRTGQWQHRRRWSQPVPGIRGMGAVMSNSGLEYPWEDGKGPGVKE